MAEQRLIVRKALKSCLQLDHTTRCARALHKPPTMCNTLFCSKEPCKAFCRAYYRKTNTQHDADSDSGCKQQCSAAGMAQHLQAYVQRATTSCIVPIKSLGQGAFAQVDLCHVPVGTSKKLLVRKMLVPGSRDGSTGIAAPSPLVSTHHAAQHPQYCSSPTPPCSFAAHGRIPHRAAQGF